MALPGSIVAVGKLVTPGGAQGPQGPAGSIGTIPLADTTQDGFLRKVSGNTSDFVDGTNNCQPIVPQITSVRLRVLNSVGNPNFEVDQRNVHVGLTNPANGTWLCDRYKLNKAGTMVINTANPLLTNPLLVPGTNFAISSSQLGLSLTTAQASLGASDQLAYTQYPEGPNWRELSVDVSSLSLLVNSSVVPLKFSVSLRSPDGTQSLVKLCTVSASGWNLLSFPNIPKPSSGNFSISPGVMGYTLTLTLACGTTFIAPVADTWQSGNFLGAPGTDNWCANPVNSAFYAGFIQHEPGPLCTTLIDKPFTQNLDECLRYYSKSYQYGVAPKAVNNTGCMAGVATPNQNLFGPFRFPKPMAKAPSVITYSTQTGSVGSGAGAVYDLFATSDRAVSSISYLGDSGFSYVSMTTVNAAQTIYTFHYTADTGW